LFKDFSPKELKYYLGFGFIFFILTTFLFTHIFFGVIYNLYISLQTVLILHDLLYMVMYILLVLLLAFFFKLNRLRTILFVLPQFYIYEYLGGIFVEGIDYFILSPKLIAIRIFIVAIEIIVLYLTLSVFKV
jgi:hypothetical protein